MYDRKQKQMRLKLGTQWQKILEPMLQNIIHDNFQQINPVLAKPNSHQFIITEYYNQEVTISRVIGRFN